MNFDKYQNLAARTDSHESGENPVLMALINRGIDDYRMQSPCTKTLYECIHDAIAPTWELIIAALGLAGEAGEIVEHVKKHIAQGHAVDPARLHNEGGDVLWYIAKLSRCNGMAGMESMAVDNIDKLKRRYLCGFTVEDSTGRGK